MSLLGGSRRAGNRSSSSDSLSSCAVSALASLTLLLPLNPFPSSPSCTPLYSSYSRSRVSKSSAVKLQSSVLRVSALKPCATALSSLLCSLSRDTATRSPSLSLSSNSLPYSIRGPFGASFRVRSHRQVTGNTIASEHSAEQGIAALESERQQRPNSLLSLPHKLGHHYFVFDPFLHASFHPSSFLLFNLYITTIVLFALVAISCSLVVFLDATLPRRSRPAEYWRQLVDSSSAFSVRLIKPHGDLSATVLLIDPTPSRPSLRSHPRTSIHCRSLPP